MPGRAGTDESAKWRGAWLLLPLAVVLVGLIRRAPRAIERLLLYQDLGSAIDLRIRFGEALRWWQGDPIYATDAHAVYPPFSYLFFRLMIGSDDFTVARFLWAMEFLAALLVATWLAVRHSGARSWPERLCVALLPLALEATWRGVVNGQFTVVPVVAAVGACVLATRRQPTWPTDLLAACLFALAVAKPTIGAPFYWVLLFVPGRFRPGLLALPILGALTLVAAIPQDAGVAELVARWLARAIDGASQGAIHGGNANAQTLLGTQGFALAGPLVALGLLGGFGAWASGRAGALLWPMLGVAGIAARLSVYHRSYDDVLLFPAFVALARGCLGADGEPLWMRRVSGGVLAILAALMVTDPLWFLDGALIPTEVVLPAVWLVTLLWLVVQTERDWRTRVRPREGRGTAPGPGTA